MHQKDILYKVTSFFKIDWFFDDYHLPLKSPVQHFNKNQKLPRIGFETIQPQDQIRIPH